MFIQHTRGVDVSHRVNRRVVSIAAFLAIASGLPVAHGADELIVDDPLLGSTKGSVVGDPAGLTPNGFMPAKAHNRTATGLVHRVGHIFYELPFTVVEGRIEVEVTGFDPSTLGAGGDDAFVIQYDGRGIQEPLVYDQFKSNFFRWTVHWRQDRQAFKGTLNLAEPVPARENATYAVFAGADILARDFTSEPTGSGVNWMMGKWHKMVIEWRAKTWGVKVDGVSRWSTTGPWEYRPVVHRIWVGGGPGKYINMASSLVMRNFKLFSYRKETLRKDTPPPLGGLPIAPPTMGMGTGGMGGQVDAGTLPPIDSNTGGAGTDSPTPSGGGGFSGAGGDFQEPTGTGGDSEGGRGGDASDSGNATHRNEASSCAIGHASFAENPLWLLVLSFLVIRYLRRKRALTIA